MATYKTPGVYLEEIAKFPPSIAEVETAIPAFIGYTKQQGLSGNQIEPVKIGSTTYNVEVARISSMLEYETLFGSTLAGVKVTFETDGRITPDFITAAPINTMYYHLQLYFANGGGPCYIVSVGTPAVSIVKDALSAGLTAISRYDEPTLLLFPEAVNLAASADAYALYNDALAQCELLKDRFVIMDCHGKTNDVVGEFRSGISTSNLKYGAAYYPYLNTSLNYLYDESAVTIAGVPGSTTLSALKSADNNKYIQAKQALTRLHATLNPGPAIAGVYASVDDARGVWKAPANVSLAYVTGPAVQLSDEDQEGLNVDTTAGKSINAIRTFAGKGTLVWGARTLAGNDNEWRYVPVRRFFNMVEESTKKAVEAFVFEPNDANTWTKIQGMIENYLVTLWRAGALQGAKPEHAFYVSVGLGKTMTALDILEGRLYVEIGMAVVRPAEFIVLRFSHMMAQS